MSVLRQLTRSLSTRPLGGAHAANTNVEKLPASSPTENASSSEVVPLPEVKDMPVAAEIISGAPTELRHRLVRIYQPTRNTMQSGGAKGEKWRIDWDVSQGAGRWLNPLMGWSSSADYMQGTRVSFNTKEDAIRFAEQQGWDYYIQPTTVKRIPPKNYSENFSYKPNKLRIVRTK